MKTMNAQNETLKEDMIRLLVIEGIKRELDGVRASTKHIAPSTPGFEPVTPSTPSHVSPANDTRSSSVRAIINNSLKDIVYGRGENRMAMRDADKTVLAIWAKDAGLAAAGNIRLQDRMVAIGKKLKGNATVNSIKDADLQKVWDRFEKVKNSAAA
jgi:hypothetical protein